MNKSKNINFINIFIVSITAFLFLMPILYMFSTSLRPMNESFSLPPKWLPSTFYFENYLYVIFEMKLPMLKIFYNTFKITFIVTIVQLFTCSLSAYAFAKLKFPFKNTLFILLLSSLMIPQQVLIVPLFLLMRDFQLIDNHWSVILVNLGSTAFGVLLLRQHYLTLPNELIDSAQIDGANHLQIYFRIALPLSKSALAALGIIVSNNVWNNFFYPYIFLNDMNNYTLPLGLALLSGNPGAFSEDKDVILMAAVGFAVIPVLIVFIIGQRWIVEAFTKSGLKG